MLGMNRFSQRDTRYSFNMGHMRDYNDLWLPSVDSKEKTHSTPFYEVSKAVDEVRSEFTEIRDHIAFIFGRGHIGNSAEEDLSNTLLNCKQNYGEDAFHIIYAKSYGAIDAMRALKILRETYHYKPEIGLLVLVDGYGISRAKRSVTEDNRFVVPGNVKRAYGIVQREKGFHGFKVGKPKDTRCSNYVIQKDDVKGKIYDHYNPRENYKRKLKVCHKHMEEIVAVVPCCNYQGRMLTTNDLIKETLRKVW